jgi:non-heme chloroperoxidase
MIPGYPFTSSSWEKQISVLLDAGRRVITYDRRGFGKSSHAAKNYSIDVLAADLNELIVMLDLTNLTIIGCSLGSGEALRYMATHGEERISKAVLISSIAPYLLKTETNLEGIDPVFFSTMRQAIKVDRPRFMSQFLDRIFNVDLLIDDRITHEALQSAWNIAAAASAYASLLCIDCLAADFRADLFAITRPVLVIHGEEDRIAPVAAAALRTHRSLHDSKLVMIPGGPHGIIWTHSEIVNREILEFLP